MLYLILWFINSCFKYETKSIIVDIRVNCERCCQYEVIIHRCTLCIVHCAYIIDYRLCIMYVFGSAPLNRLFYVFRFESSYYYFIQITAVADDICFYHLLFWYSNTNDMTN